MARCWDEDGTNARASRPIRGKGRNLNEPSHAGWLREGYTDEAGQGRTREEERQRERSRSRQRPSTSYKGTITTIFGGSFGSGQLTYASKRRTREILFVHNGVKNRRGPVIAFSDEDLRYASNQRDDPMVVSFITMDYKLGLSASMLEKCSGTLFGFARKQVAIKGMVKLGTTFVEEAKSRGGEAKGGQGEVNKLLEVQYPTWLANVVMVRKPNGKWRMCMNNIDLNKARPRDPYPFPSIDRLMDEASEFVLLSFMDAYSEYN
ncbi:hypothetical protein CR513_27937, partial [Mucuna pruriens]